MKGHPRSFKTDEEFYNKVVEYIKYCRDNKRLANVAGFSVYADINQDTFYAQKEYYSETFKKVNDLLEDEALNNKDLNDTRVIFYMKNKCGYKDRQEIDNNISVKDPFDELSVEELKKLANDD